MKVSLSTVVAAREAWSGMLEVTHGAPDLGQAVAGQFVLVRAPNVRDPVLPSPLLISGHDSSTGLVTTLVPGSTRLGGVSNEPQPGQPLQILGPLGRPFVVDRRSRRALLLGAGAGTGTLLFLARRLLDDGHDVTFLGVATQEGGLAPATMMPRDVEYLTVTSDDATDAANPLVAAAEPLLAWADALYTALPFDFLAPLTRALRRRLLRLRKGYAQALVLPGLLPCGVAACDLCTIGTREGNRRLCRDGLVFDLLSLV